MANDLHKYTVQEATNLSLDRVVKVTPTFTADDNADDHVAFNWTEIPGLPKGRASTLNSIFMLNGNDLADTVMELVFCRGGDDDGTAPTAAQKLGVGSAVVDITQAETQEIEICGQVNILVADHVEGDLLTARIAQKTGIGLVMSPRSNSTSLYVGGIWRFDAGTPATDKIDFYFGFQG